MGTLAAMQYVKGAWTEKMYRNSWPAWAGFILADTEWNPLYANEEAKKIGLRGIFTALNAPFRPTTSTLCLPTSDVLLKERQAALTLNEVSAKVRTGPPIDDEADLDWPAWAGVIPLKTVAGEPIPDALDQPTSSAR